ncbi:glycosyltransferase [Cobetia sp. 3AK]|uniref:glycosyltransferase n=1 Tax=Cobetia sp. 3AK TaxID=3040020 RepID=UPI00244CC439|nr:glycosyltransferase [Cobetia sp. 3AK]MDH2373880.1 glycosyltransferase [Cobetia sp. 3AK]
MKIYYVTPSFYPAVEYGGPIFSTLNVCRELLKIGVTLDIQTTNVNRSKRLDLDTTTHIYVEKLGGKVWYHKETITDRLSLSLLLNMPKAIKKSNLVHTQSIFSISTPTSIILSRLYKKPIVVSPRGSLGEWCFNQGSRFKTLWINIFFKPFIKHIYWHVTADYEKEDIKRVFPFVNDNQFIVIPNGVDKFSDEPCRVEALENHIGMELPKKYILSVGRIDKKKGFDYTIKALSDLDEDIHLIIAGSDYGEKEYLIGLSRDMGLETRVHFVGQVNGIMKAALYENATIFMLNSRHENFGNVYLESLSYGTPVIASDNTPWNMLDENKVGFCVKNEPEIIAQMAKNLIHIAQEDNLGLKKRCKNFASNYYWESIAESFLDEYNRIRG